MYDLRVKAPDHAGDQQQDQRKDDEDDGYGEDELLAQFLHQFRSIPRYDQMPLEFREISCHDVILLLSVFVQVPCLKGSAFFLPGQDSLLVILLVEDHVKQVHIFIAGILGGYFDLAGVIDQIGAHIELILVLLQRALQGINPHSHAHYAKEGSVIPVYLAVDEDGNCIAGSFHLVIIYIYAIFIV